jgi:lipoprotein NlpD
MASLILVSGCAGLGTGDAGRERATPEFYTVKAGDTLFAIARRFHVDYRDVARWNALGDGSLIYPGQRLRLRSPGATGPSSPSEPRTGSLVAAPQWQWPADGEVVLGFGQSPRAAAGIVIGGRAGQPVMAAADGEVVYSGSGLAGYGQLVIIRHNAAWLSAYGHNDELLVHEGDRVRAGQPIGHMGPGADLAAALHFEIRRDGQPLDPLELLPERP